MLCVLAMQWLALVHTVGHGGLDPAGHRLGHRQAQTLGQAARMADADTAARASANASANAAGTAADGHSRPLWQTAADHEQGSVVCHWLSLLAHGTPTSAAALPDLVAAAATLQPTRGPAPHWAHTRGLYQARAPPPQA